MKTDQRTDEERIDWNNKRKCEDEAAAAQLWSIFRSNQLKLKDNRLFFLRNYSSARRSDDNDWNALSEMGTRASHAILAFGWSMVVDLFNAQLSWHFNQNKTAIKANEVCDLITSEWTKEKSVRLGKSILFFKILGYWKNAVELLWNPNSNHLK